MGDKEDKVGDLEKRGGVKVLNADERGG